ILLLVAVVCFVLNWVVQAFTVGMAATGNLSTMSAGSTFSLILVLGSMITFFAHIIVFQLLLRALAVAMRRSGLAGSITAMMIVGGVGILFSVMAFVIVAFGVAGAASATNIQQAQSSVGTSGVMAVLSGCLSAILMLTWFIWYIISLFMVRATISEKIG